MNINQYYIYKQAGLGIFEPTIDGPEYTPKDDYMAYKYEKDPFKGMRHLGYTVSGIAGGNIGYNWGNSLAKKYNIDPSSFKGRLLRYGLGALGGLTGFGLGVGANRLGRAAFNYLSKESEFKHELPVLDTVKMDQVPAGGLGAALQSRVEDNKRKLDANRKAKLKTVLQNLYSNNNTYL